MSDVPIFANEPWVLPSRGRIAMWSLIVAESAIFSLFVVAYIYYIGRDQFGPTPSVLDRPILNTICLLSSSLTIWIAERAIEQGRMRRFAIFWAITILLGLKFIIGTITEFRTLINRDGLTIDANLFGTTFYSLVGLHATHVIVGLVGLTLILVFTLFGKVNRSHAERIQVFSMYWHFVDAVWVVVFTVVYIVGK
jgi:cytochrome c oxidase subunit III